MAARSRLHAVSLALLGVASVLSCVLGREVLASVGEVEVAEPVPSAEGWFTTAQLARDEEERAVAGALAAAQATEGSPPLEPLTWEDEERAVVAAIEGLSALPIDLFSRFHECRGAGRDAPMAVPGAAWPLHGPTWLGARAAAMPPGQRARLAMHADPKVRFVFLATAPFCDSVGIHLRFLADDEEVSFLLGDDGSTVQASVRHLAMRMLCSETSNQRGRGDSRWSAAFLRRLHSGTRDDVGRLLDCLGDRDHPDLVVLALSSMVRRQDLDLAAQALELPRPPAGRHRDAFESILRSLAADARPVVRAVVARRADWSWDDPVDRAMLRRLVHDPMAVVRAAALDGWPFDAPLPRSLASFLRDPSPDVRLAALSRARDDTTLLASGLVDHDPRVRSEAAHEVANFEPTGPLRERALVVAERDVDASARVELRRRLGASSRVSP